MNRLIMLGLIFFINTNMYAKTTGNEIGKNPDSLRTFVSHSGLDFERQLKNDKIKSELSTLWTFVTLDMITADVLSLFIPEGMEEWEEFADGKEAELMLGGAIMYQIPISMVFLSKVLPYKANRWANIIAAGLMTTAVVAGGETDPHYVVCASAEVIGMSLIAWKAWKWPNPEGKICKKKHDVSLKLNAEKKVYGLSYSLNF